jgi:hypothetical protein
MLPPVLRITKCMWVRFYVFFKTLSIFILQLFIKTAYHSLINHGVNEIIHNGGLRYKSQHLSAVISSSHCCDFGIC